MYDVKTKLLSESFIADQFSCLKLYDLCADVSTSRYCVVEMCASLAETLKTCGPFLVAGDGVVDGIVNVLISIISKKHPCQVHFDDEDEDEITDEHSEDDWSIISAAFDTVAGLAKALGGSFHKIFPKFQKLIIRNTSALCSPKRGGGAKQPGAWPSTWMPRPTCGTGVPLRSV